MNAGYQARIKKNLEKQAKQAELLKQAEEEAKRRDEDLPGYLLDIRANRNVNKNYFSIPFYFRW